MVDNIPPDIKEADAKVRKWVREQEDKAAQPPRENAFEKFRRLPRADVPPVMPAWDANRKD
jgi:hypothetical protein